VRNVSRPEYRYGHSLHKNREFLRLIQLLAWGLDLKRVGKMGTFLYFFLSNMDTSCCQRRRRSVGCVRYSVGGLRGPMYCPCGFTPRRDRCRLFTTDPKGRQGYVSCDKGGGLHHFEEWSCSSPFFILVLAVFFSLSLRQFSS
jgi:hypothetical protein